MRILLFALFLLSCKRPIEPIGERQGPTNPIKTFHLNYSPTKNWDKCKSDFVIFDMFDTSLSDFKKCSSMGATMICYFSSQYESWRPDATTFGKLSGNIGGGPDGDWQGEKWVDPNDPKNLEVMYKRLLLAKEKCSGIDLDNIDADGHKFYIEKIFKRAKELGLLVSQKNAIEHIEFFKPLVDLYQNEQCQQYKECDQYLNLGKPVFNIEYKDCIQIPQLYSVKKDIRKMDSYEVPCN